MIESDQQLPPLPAPAVGLTRLQFFQTGWATDDIDRAMRGWLRHGVGPFFIRRGIHMDTLSYRGEPTQLTVSIATAFSGETQIELIQQHRDDPSPYRDTYPSGPGGFHHLGAFSDTLDADVGHFRDAGIATAMYGTAGTVRFAYFDTTEELGCMTELVDSATSGDLRAYFDTVAVAARAWDGSEPVREG